MTSRAGSRIDSTSEKSCYYPDGEIQHLIDLITDANASMHDSFCFEELDKTVKPFNDAAYRQWERDFESNLNNKPLPPLPKEPDSVVYLRSENAQVEQIKQEQVREDELSSPIQKPRPVVTPFLKTQQPRPNGGSLFPPLQQNSVWEQRAERIALQGQAKKEDQEFKSLWSPVTVEEEKKSKGCCVAM